ncbi:MAG: RimK family protein [Rhodothermales bacterium]
MKKLVVADEPFELSIPDVAVVSARSYLTDPCHAALRNVRVFNLCREVRYLSRGYYVSLLAEARGHKVIPSVKTLQDLKAPPHARGVPEETDALVQRSLRRLRSTEFVLSVYFGENVAKQYLKLSQALYRQFQAPLMRARFSYSASQERWTLHHVRPIGMREIPEEHLPFVRDAAERYFSRKRHVSARPDRTAYDLAILVDPKESVPPSNKKALDRFADAANEEGFSVSLLTSEDYARLAEYDALLIRATTAVDHYTYRFARRAQTEGLAVLDDPDAILRCANKVYLAEMLRRADLPAPKTMIVHRENRRGVARELGLPCVLKLPDASFSRGVTKTDTPEALQAELTRMLKTSDLVIAQAFTPTDFDWRIGVLDGAPLYACKYFMARDHWQIYNWNSSKKDDTTGTFETLPIEEVPAPILEAALGATRLLGNGLYGVDLKEVNGSPLLIEINDNPSIDAGVEDAVIGDRLYLRIIQALKLRIERQRRVQHVP